MIRAVIFDLDGTLVDSFAQYVESFNAALKASGLPEISSTKLKKYYGQTPNEILRQLMKKPYADKDVLDAVQSMYRHYSSMKGARIKILPGVLELVRDFYDRKILIAIASSAGRRAIDESLDKIGVLKNISTIVSSSDIQNSKPHPEIFFKAAERLKIQPKDCLVFEDSPHGVLAAKAAGMKCIAVATGTTSKTDLKKLKPDMVIEDMTEILPPKLDSVLITI